MTEPIACLNDCWLPLSQAGISLFDAGFVFGATLVETQRTFQRKLSFGDLHLDRFQRGISRCGFPEIPKREYLLRVMQELIQRNSQELSAEDELSVYLFATPGNIDGKGPSTWGVYSRPFDFARYRPFFETGADLLVPEVSPIPADCLHPHIKHRSRLHWWLANRQVRAEAAPEIHPLPLLIDEAGIVYDTPIAHIGCVLRGWVCFPKSEKVLDGIGLKITREILKERGVKFIDDDIPLADLMSEADEAFLTGSSIGVCPVRSVADSPLPKNPGRVTRLLQEGWNERCGLDISHQFLIER